MRIARYLMVPAIFLHSVLLLAAQDRVDLATISAIRNEGLQASQVMDHLSWLADVYGPRVTGSPAILQASDWAISRFTEWGLANPHREYWNVGEGWSLRHFDANMVEPQTMPIIGMPVAWTPGTNGVITAQVVAAYDRKTAVAHL
jgi:carboxypeptidase Q